MPGRAGIGDAEMNQASNAGPAGRGEELLAALDGAGKGVRSIVRMDPVGVVERVSAAHDADQAIDVVEVERSAGDLLSEVRRWTRIVRQRPNLVARGEQPAGDEAPGVTEGAGDDISRGHDSVLGLQRR